MAIYRYHNRGMALPPSWRKQKYSCFASPDCQAPGLPFHLLAAVIAAVIGVTGETSATSGHKKNGRRLSPSGGLQLLGSQVDSTTRFCSRAERYTASIIRMSRKPSSPATIGSRL